MNLIFHIYFYEYSTKLHEYEFDALALNRIKLDLENVLAQIFSYCT